MINLLPQQQKDELKQEESFKLVLILGIVVLAFLISLFLILFSIKVSIEGQIAAQRVFLEQKKTENVQFQNLTERIKSLNLALSKLNTFYQEELNLVKISNTITDALPSGVYLTALNFNRSAGFEKEKYSGKIFLAGYSPTRQALIDFKKNLEKEERFEEVYFPPENWVEPVDVDFTANFKIK